MRVLTCISGLCVILGITLIILISGPSPPFNAKITGLLQNNTIERWENHHMPSTEKYRTERTSPLVTQAQIYAKLLNPPKKPEPGIRKPAFATSKVRVEAASIPEDKLQATPQKVSPRFRVHATSVFAKHPERSMALISEPGKGIFWIQPGDMLGYIKVAQIHKDAVAYTFEDTSGEVAWEPHITTMPPSPKATSSNLAINVTPALASPTTLPPRPASPLPSRLAESQDKQRHPISPRPLRGGR